MFMTGLWAVIVSAILTIPALAATKRPAKAAETATETQSASPSVLQALVLDGRPFPHVTRFVAPAPAPARTLFVANAKENGDGSDAHPWNDLQAALCSAVAGDRVTVRKGNYTGPIRVDGPCHDGAAGKPIQVVFEKGASLAPAGDASALVIRKSYWDFSRLDVRMKESAAEGIVIEGPAHAIGIDEAVVAGGGGTSIAIHASAADITISNCELGHGARSQGDAGAGIDVFPDTAHVRILNNRILRNPGGGVRLVTPAEKTAPAHDIDIVGNSLRGNSVAAVSVAGAMNVLIENNTIIARTDDEEGRAIAVDAAYHVTVRTNEISDYAVGVQVGRLDPADQSVHVANDVVIEHNHLQSDGAESVALDLEGGARVRFANNLAEGFANGVVLLGRAPLTREVSVMNNLVIGLTGVAFSIADSSSTSLFDYNVFSALAVDAQVEMAGETMPLTTWLKRRTMPHTRLVHGVLIFDRDLARIRGVDTVDQGTVVAGMRFLGKAPDVGVAER